HMSGCDSNQPAEASNRNGYRSFPDLSTQDFQADFTLPEADAISGSISIGAESESVSLHRTASFHGVSYDSPTGSTCELTASKPTCSVQLTWYTGGNYPAATVYAHNVTSNAYSKVMTSGQAPAVDFPYQLSEAGLYEFELRMGDGEQTTLMAKSAGFTVTRELSNASPESPPQPATPPIMSAGSSSSVGATVGEFRVDASGSATYSIPVLAAPASGGFKPNISLNYNSQGGNGSVGVGWSLGGLSSISLCPQTMEHDGISGSRGVRLDGEDRFCLDGQRLVLDPSTGDYGDDGAQYRTEIDSFARVTSYGSSGNGPAWFKVERKNGTVVEYGRSDDSRIEARGSASPATVFTWAQNRVEDRARNYITYSYAKNSTGPVAYDLQAIDYTGNSRANTLPSARLLFTYSDRDTAGDLTYNYFLGVELEQRRLLQSIRSQGRVDANSPLQDLRFYQLTYDADGVGRAILTELTECRSALRNTCYQPTRFEWLKSESTIDTAATVINGLLPKNSLSGLLLADVSGDGRADLLFSQVKSKRHVLYVKEAKAGEGFSEWPENYTLTKKHDGQTPRLFAIDINSDGLQDVVYSKYSKATDDYTWVALVSDGNGLSAETYLNPGHRFFLNGENLESRFRIMDFDGDGLSDILHAHTDVLGNAWQLTILLNQTAAGGNPGFSAPIEVDVDNADLFPKAIAGGWDLHTEPPFYNWAIDGPDKKETPDARTFDFNGDGAVDLLIKVWRHYQKCVANCDQQPSGGGGQGGKGGKNKQPEYHVEFASFWVLMESNGQNAFTRHSVVAKGEDCTIEVICDAPGYDGLPRSENVWPIDINADGLADLAWGDANESWYFRLNTGRGFAPAQLIGQVAGETNKLVRFEDWNGDTFPDLVYPSATLNGGAKWMLHQNYFGRVFAAATNTQVPAGNVGGDSDVDQVENDSSLFADFNGDGKTDQLLIDSNRYGEILATSMRKGMNFSGSRAVAPANVITSIINGFGARTDITYKPLTDTGVYSRMYDSAAVNWGRGAAVYDYIAPFYVVSKVTGSSPTFNNPSARNRAEYHYAGAKLQAGGRGLLGFAEIIIYDPQLQIRTNTRYRQDFPFTGLPIDVSRAVSSAGSKFDPVTVVSSRQPVAVPAVTPDTQPPATISGTLLSYSVKQWKQSSVVAGTWQIHSDKSLQHTYTLAGNIESRILTENRYDNRGNLTRSAVSTYDQSEPQPFSKQTTQNRWSANATSGWNLGNLLESTVTHARSGSASVTRMTEFAYDPVTAFMVQEIIEPDNPKLKITSTFSYDSFGNRRSTSKIGAGMSARTSRVAYDPQGRFVVRETNALGQVFRTVGPGQWDIFGNALEIRNIDGVISTSAVDLMGRPFASYNQAGAWKRTLNYFGRGDYCPAGTVWHSIETNGGGALSQQCFDVSGRNVRSISRSITNRMVFVDRFYDSSGRPSRVSEPYFKNDQAHWNETAYDRAGRITGLVSAGGADVSTRYDEEASGHCVGAGSRVTVTENALGQKTTELRNVLGETTDSYDDNCGHVSFSYDAMGYLRSVTGADGVITRMEYDGAGRKTKQIDPDKGVTQYAYNALGELTRQLDGKQQAIDFEYDSLGRVTHRRELRNVSSLSDTTFDTVNHEVSIFKTVSPGKSQPASVTYHAGEGGVIVHQRTIGYDSLGRESSVTHLIDDQLFYQQSTYDAYGRPFQKFDGSGDFRGLRYAYRYGHLSQLKEAREGASGVVYQEILDTDAKGNVTLASLGNGVTAVA
ncbi:MAG: VCBS repeat-containing protein, partial [Gammaproteobacteria bacterium]|nr:VCBS repeat-containing protein [Gammaproteobacteria bacterium]